MARLLIPFVVSIASAALLAACSSSPPPSTAVVVAPTTHKGHGPPPHAPAHGYRHKHGDGVNLVYDSGLGLYLVADVTGRYYWKGNYYRHRGSQWELSVSLGGPWIAAHRSKLPPGLKKSKKAKKEKNAAVKVN
jgi:hypothetical protein